MPLAVGMFVVLGLWWIVLLGITPSKAYFGAFFLTYSCQQVSTCHPQECTLLGEKNMCVFAQFMDFSLQFCGGILMVAYFVWLLKQVYAIINYHQLSSTIINYRHHDHHFHHYHYQSLSSLYIISFTPLCYCITIRDQYPFRMDADGNPTRRQHWATDWMGRN